MSKQTTINQPVPLREDPEERLRVFLDTSKMPPLPPIFKNIAKICPPSILPAVMLCMLPILGMLGSRLRFTFSDDQVNSPEFLVCLIGESGSGKSFITKLRNMLLKDVDAMDDQGRAQERAYTDEMTKAAVKNNSKKGSKGEPPDKPHPLVRILEPHTSMTKMLERVFYAMELHCITITAEIDEVIDALKKAFSNYTVFLRKAFDNDRYGQDYASKDSFSATVKAMYNVLYGGTPAAVKRLFTDVNNENGFTRRFIFPQIPDRTYEEPLKWKKFTEEQQQELDRLVRRLSEVSVRPVITRDADGIEHITYEPCEEHWMELPWLNRCMDRWEKDVRELARVAGAKDASDCRLRVSNVGARAGALAFYLYGEKDTPKVRRDVCAFAVWVANSMLNGLLEMLGAKQGKKTSISHLDAYLKLPETFTRAQLQALLGNGEDARHVISKWKNVDHVIDPNLPRGAEVIRKISAIKQEELHPTAFADPTVEEEACVETEATSAVEAKAETTVKPKAETTVDPKADPIESEQAEAESDPIEAEQAEAESDPIESEQAEASVDPIEAEQAAAEVDPSEPQPDESAEPSVVQSNIHMPHEQLDLFADMDQSRTA